MPAMPVMVDAKEETGEEKENMMQQVKDAGVAGIISYVFWEWAFWGVSVPVCIFGYREVRQHPNRAWLGRGYGVRTRGWAAAQTRLRHRRMSELTSHTPTELGAFDDGCPCRPANPPSLRAGDWPLARLQQPGGPGEAGRRGVRLRQRRPLRDPAAHRPRALDHAVGAG